MAPWSHRNLDDELADMGDRLMREFGSYLREQLTVLRGRLEKQYGCQTFDLPPNFKSPRKELEACAGRLAGAGTSEASSEGTYSMSTPSLQPSTGGSPDSITSAADWVRMRTPDVMASMLPPAAIEWREQFPGIKSYDDQGETDMVLEAEKRLAQQHATVCLLSAASNDDHELVKQLLEANAAINEVRLAQDVPLLEHLHAHLECKHAVYRGQFKVQDPPDTKRLAPLLVAGFYGCARVAELLCKAGAEVDPQGQCSWAPLAMAASKGHLEVVQRLVQHGARLDQRDCLGFTPLHLAAAAGATLVVQYLCHAGAGKGLKASGGSTPMDSAIASGHLEVLNCLLEAEEEEFVPLAGQRAGAPLFVAACQDCPDLVERLVRVGFDANELCDMQDLPDIPQMQNARFGVETHYWYFTTVHNCKNPPDPNLVSPLHLAILSGARRVVRALCEAQADVNLQGPLGYTPLNEAASCYDMEVVQYLAEQGAVLGTPHCFGGTALHSAATGNCVQLLDFLRTSGLDVNATENDGGTPLHIATMWGRTDTVRFLIEAGAKLEEKNTMGHSPLHVAARHGKVSIMALLCKARANMNSVSRDGLTPLQTAAILSHIPVIRSLLEAGDDIHATNRRGETALHRAAFSGSLESIRCLLEARADMECSRTDGTTALHLAAFGGHTDVASLLVEKGANKEAMGLCGYVLGKATQGRTAKQIAMDSGHLELASILA